MRSVIALVAFLLVASSSALSCNTLALPVMDLAFSDPEGDAFLTNGTTPANVSVFKNVTGYPEIDIRRTGSALNGQTVTLFMQLFGTVSQKARYYFLARTTGSGSIWGLYDFVVEFTNTSARVYFATSIGYQNLSEAKSFDMNASTTRKPGELYANVPLDLLRNPPSFQLIALALLPKDNSTSYVDWTKNAKLEGQERSDIDDWLLPIAAFGFLLIIVIYFGLRGTGEAEKKDVIACKRCGRRFSKDMLYCPTCGRDAEDKKTDRKQ